MTREIAEVNVGEYGESRIKVAEAFAQQGVKVSPNYITELRSGRGSGNVIVNYRVLETHTRALLGHIQIKD